MTNDNKDVQSINTTGFQQGVQSFPSIQSVQTSTTSMPTTISNQFNSSIISTLKSVSK